MDYPENDSKGARFFCYARISTGEQGVASLSMQEDSARRRCELLEGVFVETFRETASASKITWEDRPQFRRLIANLRRGDHLVVWNMDRIDRSWNLVNAIQKLHQMGVTIHMVEQICGSYLPPIDTVFGTLMIMIFVIASRLSTEDRRQHAIASAAFRKANGYAYNGNVPMGKRRIVLPLPPGQRGTPFKRDIWDETQCAILRDIVRRKDAGESFDSIARDYYNEFLADASGYPWARVRTARPGELRIDSWRIRRAYALYKHLEKTARQEGADMNCLPFVSEANGNGKVSILAAAKVPTLAKVALDAKAEKKGFRGGAGI